MNLKGPGGRRLTAHVSRKPSGTKKARTVMVGYKGKTGSAGKRKR